MSISTISELAYSVSPSDESPQQTEAASELQPNQEDTLIKKLVLEFSSEQIDQQMHSLLCQAGLLSAPHLSNSHVPHSSDETNTENGQLKRQQKSGSTVTIEESFAV